MDILWNCKILFLTAIEHCLNSSKFDMYVCLGVLHNVLPFFCKTCMLLHFREITYAKNVGFPSGIFLLNAKQKKSMVDFAANLKQLIPKEYQQPWKF